MSRSYWLLVWCLLFCCSFTKAFPHIDENHEAPTIKAELNVILQEPMFSGILNWADHKKELTELPWIVHASCKNNTPRHCLLDHYLEMYLEQRAQAVLNLSSLPVVASLIWFTMTGLSVTALWLGGMTITPDLLFGAITIYGVGIVFITAMHGYHQESIWKHLNKAAKNKVLTKAKNDYLQLIFSLLADSVIDTGAAIETFIEKVTPFEVDESFKGAPINLHTLSRLQSQHFYGKARQVILLDENQEQTGFFKIFVHSPKPGQILLILESENKRYTLKADKFNLTPLLTLLSESGVKLIRLPDPQRSIIRQ